MTRMNRSRRMPVSLTGGALGLVLLLAIGGCDTVAEISFDQRNFTSIQSNGVINALNCSNPDVDVVLRFTLADEKSDLISPGERIGSGTLEVDGVDANFTSEDLEFSNQSMLYPSPDVECSECQAPFSCQPINPFNPGSSRQVCGMPLTIIPFQGNVHFDAGSDTKNIALVMDYSQTLEGVAEDGSFDASRSTDPQDKRISSAMSFVSRFRNTRFGEDSRMCVVSFGGEGRAAVNFRPDPNSCMSGNYDQALSSVSPMGVGETGKSPVWSAIIETIEQQLSTASGDRVMVLFTDGLDDGSLTDNFDAALSAAVGNEVTVHVVQLDNPPRAEDGTRPYLGPEDEYARLACSTGGSFQYARAPEDLRPMFTALATNVAASYETELQLGALSQADVPAGRYRVATAMSVNLLGESHTFQFAGDQTDATSNDIVDLRISVFKRPVPARAPAAGEGTGEGDEGGTTE